MYRVTITVDFDVKDRFMASRAYAEMSEAAGRNDGDEQIYEIEWLGDLGGDEPPILCWCDAPASFANPPTDASRFPGIWQPVCHEHVADGYESLQDMEDDESIGEKLGLV